MNQDHKEAKQAVTIKLAKHEEKTEKYKQLSQKIRKREELTKEEMAEFNEMVKNSKMDKLVNNNEWIVDNLVREKFDDVMYYDIFVARCRDIGESVSIEKAKYFKEEISGLNKGSKENIICCSLKLGINAITSLCKHAKTRKLDAVNIADNAIADTGMHSVKGLLSSNCCKSLNLASNMISESGLNMVLQELTKNTSLESLDVA